MTHTRQGHSYCGMQIGNHNLAFGWYNFKTDLPLLHLCTCRVLLLLLLQNHILKKMPTSHLLVSFKPSTIEILKLYDQEY